MNLDLTYEALDNVLADVFTNDVKLTVARMINEAYFSRDMVYNKEDILQDSAVADDIKAHVLRAALSKKAEEYCICNKLPWRVVVAQNKAKNCSHVEFICGEGKIYLARVQNRESKPKGVEYRKDAEINLFSDEVKDINTFLITYGESATGEVFAGYGIPGEESWLCFKPLDLKFKGEDEEVVKCKDNDVTKERESLVSLKEDASEEEEWNDVDAK